MAEEMAVDVAPAVVYGDDVVAIELLARIAEVLVV